jgi:hypothetical protein
LDGNVVSCKVQCCDTQNYQARGYYPPSCLGPGSGVGTLAFPRSTCTSVPPPNLRPTFSNRYILTSSRDISTHVVDILWISAVQHQCICMRYPLTCANAWGAVGRFRARAFRHAVSPFSGEAASTPMVAFQANPDLWTQRSVSRPLSDRVDRRLPRSVWYRPRSYPGYLYKPRSTVVARKDLAEFDG